MEEKIVTGIYIRVSTEDQAKDGYSISAQRDKLTKYAEANDWDIYDYYVDDGISGKNLDGRPEVIRMLNDVKNKKINNILIYKLDRLTRSVKDLITLIDLFEKHKCTFNSQTEKIDTSNAVGRMFVKIIGIFAEFERENLAERVSLGYEQKTREGNYTNTNGVYGYDYIKGEQRLVVNEYEKELVNRIFDAYIDGYSYFKICKMLNEENVPTKRGGHWSSSTVKSIVNNPLYLGKVRYGVSKKIRDKAFIQDSENVEPIVSQEKWEKANSLVERRKHFCVRRYPSENSYYFHIIKCAKCGGNISARQQNQNGKLYITYKCNNATRGFCECTGFSHNHMENAFLEYLETLESLPPDESILEKENEKNHAEKTIDDLEKKIAKFESKKKLIRTQFINDLLSIDEYRVLSEELDKEIESLQMIIEDNEMIVEDCSSEYIFDDIKNIVTNIKLNWQFLTNKERQQFLEQFVDNIKVEKLSNSEIRIDSVEFMR